jgi:hypothetical protein
MSTLTQVVVHPLVLLSVTDHYTRVAKDTNRRVVGVLLGEVFRGKVDITNSYAGEAWLSQLQTIFFLLVFLLNDQLLSGFPLTICECNERDQRMQSRELFF